MNSETLLAKNIICAYCGAGVGRSCFYYSKPPQKKDAPIKCYPIKRKIDTHKIRIREAKLIQKILEKS